MSVADGYKAILENARSIPGCLGLRPYTVELVTSTRPGSYGLEGVETETVVTLLESGQPPKARQLTNEQRALAGLDSGAWEIGPITPSHSGGGTILDDLIGAATANQSQFRVRLTGPQFPNGTMFAIHEVRSDRALRYTIQIKPISQ